jgi:hypothetical protein
LQLVPLGRSQLESFCGNVGGHVAGFPPKPLTLPEPPEPLTLPEPPEPPGSLLVEPPQAARVEATERVTTNGARY